MTRLHFTLNIEDIRNLINAKFKNDMARTILIKIFNELMEKERDEYLENTSYQRNEKALLATTLEMYVQGVQVRKVSKVIENMCSKTYSKSFVSSLTK